MPSKLSIGLFSFASCEGCFANILSLLDAEHENILKILDIKSARLIQKKNLIESLDVAFIEGSIATAKDKEKLEEIRTNSKKLILLGTCACDGWPSTQRNNFLQEQRNEIFLQVKKANQLPEILTPEKIVKVDAKLSGCPIDNQAFKNLLKELFNEFGVKNA